MQEHSDSKLPIKSVLTLWVAGGLIFSVGRLLCLALASTGGYRLRVL